MRSVSAGLLAAQRVSPQRPRVRVLVRDKQPRAVLVGRQGTADVCSSACTVQAGNKIVVAALDAAGCIRVREAVGLLSSMDNASKALALAQEIDGLESEADAVMRAGISKLFREEADVRQLIKHKNVYEYLENAIDKCQDVANVIEAVVVENV